MMMVMEFVMELFFTASLSLCLAYVIAHLVSMTGYVGGGDNSVDEFVSKSSEKYEEQQEQEDDDANDDDTDVIVVEDEDLIETVDRVENHVQVEEQSSENSDESSSNFDGVKGDADDDLVDDVKGDADDDDLVDDDKSDHEVIELKLEGLVDQSCDDERKEDGEDEVKEEVLLDDDDDWEGIEKSEGEKLFSSASKFVGDSENSRLLANLGNEVQMQLYGLHKVAMEGPCREQAPMALMVSARAKWNAWQQLGNMSPDMAMEQYVTLLSGAIPGWMGEKHQGDKDIVVSEAGESRNENIVVHHQPDLKIDRKPAELQSLGENRDTGSL